MNIRYNFGFVTGCHAGDKFMVQATLASIRNYCPNVPICLTVDGEFDVSDLEREYNLIILRISDLPSAEMRQLTQGCFHAKMAAMWEGPFERYVWLDADAIVWGDITRQIRQDLDFQIFWKESKKRTIIKNDPIEQVAHKGFKHYYFDPEKVLQFDKDFKWENNVYFCAGVYACRRNVISFHEWTETLKWGIWNHSGDQGLLNYLVHAKAQRREILIDSVDLQHVWVHHGKEEFIEDCSGPGWKFPSKIERPRIAHFCGRKPLMFDSKSYSRPFTIARLEHHRKKNGEMGAWISLWYEETKILWIKIKRRLKKAVVLNKIVKI